MALTTRAANSAALRRSLVQAKDASPDVGEVLHMVVTPETDPAKIAAFASRIGPGEFLARFPARLIPEVL
ncbi:MAG: hypothetical protein ACRDS0_29560 [Pseudonocardiaceae bacterium]